MVGEFFCWKKHHKGCTTKQSQEDIPMFTAWDVDFGCHYFLDSLLQFLRQTPLPREPQTLVWQVFLKVVQEPWQELSVRDPEELSRGHKSRSLCAGFVQDPCVKGLHEIAWESVQDFLTRSLNVPCQELCVRSLVKNLGKILAKALSLSLPPSKK